MTTLTIPNSFSTGEVIEAAEMNANFTAVKTYAEALSDGSGFDAGAINTEDTTISYATIDNENYAYFILVENLDTTWQISGARIEYTQ